MKSTKKQSKKQSKKHITFRIEPEQLSLIERIITASKGKIETLSHFLRLAVLEKINREAHNRGKNEE